MCNKPRKSRPEVSGVITLAMPYWGQFKECFLQGIVAYAINPSTQEAGRSLEDNLVLHTSHV